MTKKFSKFSESLPRHTELLFLKDDSDLYIGILHEGGKFYLFFRKGGNTVESFHEPDQFKEWMYVDYPQDDNQECPF